MSISKDPPKYLRIYQEICSRIQSGALEPGERLPSFAELRAQYDAMPSTAERAYIRLEQENLVVREARRGVFVAPRENTRTGNIGLVLHSRYLTANRDASFMQMVLSGIRESSHEQGMKIVLLEDDEAAHSRQVDGLVLYGDKLEIYALGIPPQMPHVVLFQHATGLMAVTADDFGGARLATSYLIDNGHRRIACLMEPFQALPTQRRAGYQVALQEAGIKANPKWSKSPKKKWCSSPPNYLQWGRDSMRAWLNEGWRKLGCTAIVVQNDHAAIGVMQVLQEAGIDVPGQVSVIGFDGTSVCDLARPRLTSIEVPFHKIGCAAVGVLCDQINNGVQSPRETMLPVQLRAGDSVAKISSKN